MPGFSSKEGSCIFYVVNVICWIIIRCFYKKKRSQLLERIRLMKCADFIKLNLKKIRHIGRVFNYRYRSIRIGMVLYREKDKGEKMN
jgi:hypothetical protein